MTSVLLIYPGGCTTRWLRSKRHLPLTLGWSWRHRSYDATCCAPLATFQPKTSALDWIYDSIAARRNRGGRPENSVIVFNSSHSDVLGTFRQSESLVSHSLHCAFCVFSASRVFMCLIRDPPHARLTGLDLHIKSLWPTYPSLTYCHSSSVL